MLNPARDAASFTPRLIQLEEPELLELELEFEPYESDEELSLLPLLLLLPDEPYVLLEPYESDSLRLLEPYESLEPELLLLEPYESSERERLLLEP